MASLSRDKNGNYTVQFVAADNRRRSVRLGKVPKKLAEAVKLKVEHLNALAVARLPMDGETAAWVAGIGDDLAGRLAAVGLLPERRSQSLGAFLDEYLAGRAADSKPTTLVNIRQTAIDLTRFFGPDTQLRVVTPADAERLKRHLQDRPLAGSTVYGRLKTARQLFKHAVKLKLVAENPFAEVRGKNHNPAERRHYVTEADTRRLLDAAKPAWRTIIALARFGGLRNPSEVLSLRWADVNLPAGRMVVTAPKTEHIEGRGTRVMPIFARLRPHLEEAFELAEAGEEYVVGGTTGATYRAAAGPTWKSANLRTTFLKIIRRAGLAAWPRVFQNLRASCETDLMQQHPIHVVTAWIGNTPKVALGHYLQTLEADFEKAVRGDQHHDDDVVRRPVGEPPSTGRSRGEGRSGTVRIRCDRPMRYVQETRKRGWKVPPQLSVREWGGTIGTILFL